MAGTFTQTPHQESAQPGFPPELFGAVSGFGKLGAWALPSETITFASVASLLILLGILSFSEAIRYFFRLTFSPELLSGPATALSAFIAWRGSRRPGPLFPRIWALVLTLLNLLCLLSATYFEYFAPASARFSLDPFPLHPLALSGFIATAVLLPRLYPMHPLKALVQTIAPVALASVLSVTIPWCIWFIDFQMTKEQRTLTEMSRKLDAATSALHKASRFSFREPGLLRNPQASRAPVEAALEFLRAPSALAIPDATRWKAAELLENDGRMEFGQLERSTRDLIDAVREVFVTTSVPELRTGRYFALGRDAGTYQLNDQWAKYKNDRPLFSSPAEIGALYYSRAAKWLPLISPLANGKAGHYYENRMSEIQARLNALQSRGATRWWADIASPTETHTEEPPWHLSQVFETPIDIDLASIADYRHWAAVPWGKRRAAFALGDQGACRIQHNDHYNEQPILAAQESLNSDQVESGRTYYIGMKYDASAMIQCFAYHPPVAPPSDPPEPIVVELRLLYEVQNSETRASTPCTSDPKQEDPCVKYLPLLLPPETLPSVIELLVDVPPGLTGSPTYSDSVSEALKRSLNSLGSGDVKSKTVIHQSSRQDVIAIRIAEQR